MSAPGRVASVSAGRLVAAFGEGCAVLDREHGRVQILGALGHWLLLVGSTDEGAASIEDLVEDVVDALGVDRDAAARHLEESLASLRELGLLGGPRRVTVEAPPPPSSELPRRDLLEPHLFRPLIDTAVGIRSNDPELRRKLAEIVPPMDCPLPVQAVFEIDVICDERFRLRADEDWVFEGWNELLNQLDQVLEDHAIRHCQHPALRAACVERAEASSLLIVGDLDVVRPELLRRSQELRWRILTRRSTWLRPPDATPVGIIQETDGGLGSTIPMSGTLIGEVHFVEEVSEPLITSVQRLGAEEGLARLVGSLQNPALLDAQGWQSLCSVAAASTMRLHRFQDPELLIDDLGAHDPITAAPGVAVRRYEAPERFRPRRKDDVASSGRVSRLDGAAVLRRIDEQFVVLDPFTSAVWETADGTRTVAELAAGVSDAAPSTADSWGLVVRALEALERAGLLGRLPEEWERPAPKAVAQWPSGPWEHWPEWVVNCSEPDRGYSCGSSGQRFRLAGHEFTIDSPLLTGLLAPAIATGVVEPIGSPESVRVPRFCEVSGPDGQWFLVDGFGCPAVWLDLMGARRWLIRMLAAAVCPPDAIRLSPITARIYAGSAYLDLRPQAAGHQKPEVSEGLLLAGGPVLLLPDDAAQSVWFDAGCQSGGSAELHERVPLDAIVVNGEDDALDSVLYPLGALAAPFPMTSVALELLARTVTEHAVVAQRADPRTVDSSGEGGVAVDQPVPRSAEIGLWASRLGSWSRWDDSVKISAERITPLRSLFRVELTDRTYGSEKFSSKMIDTLHEAFAELGVPPVEAVEAARIAASMGEFHVGQEQGPAGGWRRKLYVWTVGTDPRPELSAAWAPLLSRSTTAPSWLAWKFSNSPGSQMERAIDLPYLDHADSVGLAAEPVLERLPAAWADALLDLVDAIEVRLDDRPQRDDALTMEESGRISIDVVNRSPDSDAGLRPIEAHLHRVCAVAGHATTAVRNLLADVTGLRLANLIFGLDSGDQPFLNLYFNDPATRLDGRWRLPGKELSRA